MNHNRGSPNHKCIDAYEGFITTIGAADGITTDGACISCIKSIGVGEGVTTDGVGGG